MFLTSSSIICTVFTGSPWETPGQVQFQSGARLWKRANLVNHMVQTLHQLGRQWPWTITITEITDSLPYGQYSLEYYPRLCGIILRYSKSHPNLQWFTCGRIMNQFFPLFSRLRCFIRLSIIDTYIWRALVATKCLPPAGGLQNHVCP